MTGFIKQVLAQALGGILALIFMLLIFCLIIFALYKFGLFNFIEQKLLNLIPAWLK